jgi:release factor glutamine methyltransferase
MDAVTRECAVARATSAPAFDPKFPLGRKNAPLSLPRRFFRKFVHFCSYHFILTRNRTATVEVSGLTLTIRPSVFHPRIFLTSKFFADFIQELDLTGKRVADVGTGSGILALSAAKAGAARVMALDINPAAADAAAFNAKQNGLAERVTALHSDLFSAVSADEKFDVILSSPPSFPGEPLSVTDRAWHAGPEYRDIAALFDQARARLAPDGRMYLLLSSDSDLDLLGRLMERAGFVADLIAEQSIVVESFILYELRPVAA